MDVEMKRKIYFIWVYPGEDGLMVAGSIILSKTPAKDLSNNMLRSKRYIRDHFSIPEAIRYQR